MTQIFKTFRATTGQAVRRFANDETGATAIEYAMIAALISIAIIAGVTQIGANTSEKMSSVTTTLEGN